MENRLLHTPEGVRDIYGEEYLKKLYIRDTLHNKMNQYGYMDIETPSFEFFDVFSNQIGTTPSKELFKFFDNENNTLVLRPDFTPSVARAAAKYFMSEKLPIRLCYLGNTFTNSSDLQGKLKEMTQIGAECIGDDSVCADAEMISMVVESLLDSGLKDFQVSIGQVEYFKGICESVGISEEMEMQLREQISNKNIFGVEEILEDRNLPEQTKEQIKNVADLFGNVDILKEAKKTAGNERSLRAIERLEELYDMLKIYGIEKYVTFDLGMLSKYMYYTGIIFRAYTFGIGDAVVKGGRYDNLLKQFGKESPAIGFCIVVDQLLFALSRQKIEIPVEANTTLIIYDEMSFKEAVSYAKEKRLQNEVVEMIPLRKEYSNHDYIGFGKDHLVHKIYKIVNGKVSEENV